MDIYNYFPSKDVADYCKKIGYEFNPIELACLIKELSLYKSIPIEEQIKLFQELIDCYPDMQFHKSVRFSLRNSLHEYLKAFIDWNERALEHFHNPNKNGKKRYYYAINPYSIWVLGLDPENIPSTDVFKRHEPYGHFDSVDILLEYIKPYWDRVDSLKRLRINICGKRLQYGLSVDIDRNGQICWLSDDSFVSFPEKKKFPGRIEDLFVYIPVPYKAGDIVSTTIEPDRLQIINSLPIHTIGSENLSGTTRTYYYSMTDGHEDYVTFKYLSDDGQWIKDDCGVAPCCLVDYRK